MSIADHTFKEWYQILWLNKKCHFPNIMLNELLDYWIIVTKSQSNGFILDSKRL